MFQGCFHLLSVSESNNDIQQCISIDIFNDNNTNSSLYEEQESDNINELNDLYFDYEFNNSLDFYYGSIISSFENISSISKEGNNYNSGNSDNKMDFIQVSSTNNNKIKLMERMFSGCLLLISIPDISKLDTSNVIKMGGLFQECNSLISLPDISKWNTSNVTDMKAMFNECNSLISLPDISIWNTSNVNDMKFMFHRCNSLISLPDISIWNTSNVDDMSALFNECKSLKSLPDISKWNTSSVTDMKYMFYEAINILNIYPEYMKNKK